MDYEKKYKEALERAKAVLEIAANKEEAEGYVSTIFPELKESEDERIRKELIKVFSNREKYLIDQSFGDITVSEILTWLEKQGETVWSEETDDDAWLNDIISKVESGCTLNSSEIKWLKSIKDKINIHYWTEEEIEPIISDYLRGAEHYGGMIGRLRCLKPKSLEKQGESYTKRDVDDAYVEGMAFAKDELEKQGEPSIKWNKNTEGNKPQVNHSVLMKTTQGIAEGEWQGEQWFQYRWASIVRDSDVLSWMELSDLEKQGEKESAWSEEDERMCQETIDWFEKKCFPYALESENPARESIKWLKSLKDRTFPQPKQEWSEEDEKIFVNLISYGSLKYTGEQVIDWLNSLKQRIGG